ncbi:cytochrome b/b6 domain-containing protein [Marinomonas sp. C1424]|uniref:Cytochrome b/b6 domain-containing protein n=1 Tax=Marinomonas transparens TaxID=2795388 RepID=A0A934JXY4_9GAMM|nr:cytochrome b/b6 domain-containing protein [Marinomonas transparens]
MTIAVLVILRIIWRIMNRVPDPEPGSKFMHLVSHLGHYTLYVMIVVMTFTGYLGTGVGTEYFFLFDLPKFADTKLFSYLVGDYLGMTFKEFEKPIDFIHKEILGKWLVWLLILGHAGAAFYHHFVQQDRTLHKMLIGRQSKEGTTKSITSQSFREIVK